MRKLVSLLMALVMLLGIVPAALADAYTLDIYWVGAGDNPDNPLAPGVAEAISEYIEPLIGAKVVFHIVPWDDWEEDAVNRLKADPYGMENKIDLIFTADWEFYGDLVASGVLIPLGDQLDRNGKEILSTLSESFLNGVKINGQIYGIPTNKELCVPMGFLVNKTAADAIGWDLEKDPVTCTADLEPWLAKYKEIYPDKYPYLMDTGSVVGRWADEPWINDWSGLENNAVAMRMAKLEDGSFDETVYSIFETPEQEAHIRLMYDWVQKGYIDPETINYTDEGHGIFGRGDFLVYTQPLKGNSIKAVEMYTQHHPADAPEWECTEIILQPRYIVTAHTAGSMFSIPTASWDPDKAMKFLNLMHSDETLVNLMLYGVEGVNYTRLDDRRVNLTDAAWYNVHAGAWTVGDVRLQYVLASEDPEKNDKLIAFADGVDPTVCLGFRLNLRKEYAEKGAAVSKVVREYANPLLCGIVDPDDPEKGIEAMKAALKEAGIDDVVAEAARQYEAWKAAQQ